MEHEYLCIENGIIKGLKKGVERSVVEIPDNVREIGYSAFYGCKLLTRVTIPDSVTKIDALAFRGCTSLESVTIPSSVREISARMFSGCMSLARVSIPDSVKAIGTWAFYKCNSLKEVHYAGTKAQWNAIRKANYIGSFIVHCVDGDVHIETHIGIEINDSVVCGYTDKLPANIVIPDGVTAIGRYAFRARSSLSPHFVSLVSVNIPGSVIEIGCGAFSGCWTLVSVMISNGVNTIGDSAFACCGRLTNVTIPCSVTTIGKEAFFGCASLASINIPSNVNTIGDSVFAYCERLTNVTLPRSVTTIGKEAFCGCTSLASLIIPNSVREISECAFKGCVSLESVTIPSSVREISARMFSGCMSLARVSIPDSVKAIGTWAFYKCNSLKEVHYAGTKAQWNAIKKANYVGSFIVHCVDGDVRMETRIGLKISGTTVCGHTSVLPAHLVIPDGVTTIGVSTFAGRVSLMSVDIPGSVTEIDDYAFSDCYNLKEVRYAGTKVQWNSIVGLCNNAALLCATVVCADGEQHMEIRNGICISGHIVFGHTNKLPANLVIPDGVTAISKYAFLDCTSLVSVTIPDNVTEIDRGAFCRCTSLLCVNISNGVTVIKNSIFRDCTSLVNVTIPDGVTTIGRGAFCRCTSLANVTMGNSVIKILDTAFEECGPNLKIRYAGTKAQWNSIAELYKNPALLYATIVCADGIQCVEVRNGMEICGTVVCGYTDGLPANLVIPDGVTAISKYAFLDCTSLVSVTIPDNVTEIGDNAFQNCVSLTSVTISDSVTEIGWVFCGCTSLADVRIGNSITKISGRAFYGCSPNLTIHYDGMKTQWESIRKRGSKSFTVHCLDGDITAK